MPNKLHRDKIGTPLRHNMKTLGQHIAIRIWEPLFLFMPAKFTVQSDTQYMINPSWDKPRYHLIFGTLEVSSLRGILLRGPSSRKPQGECTYYAANVGKKI